MKVTQDIYSLLLASCFKTDTIDKHRLEYLLREESLQVNSENYASKQAATKKTWFALNTKSAKASDPAKPTGA
jgi:arginine/lysine/ornithine decarboxylase